MAEPAIIQLSVYHPNDIRDEIIDFLESFSISLREAFYVNDIAIIHQLLNVAHIRYEDEPYSRLRAYFDAYRPLVFVWAPKDICHIYYLHTKTCLKVLYHISYMDFGKFEKIIYECENRISEIEKGGFKMEFLDGVLQEVCDAGNTDHRRALKFGERAWRIKGKKYEVVYWDNGNGWCSVMYVKPKKRNWTEDDIAEFFKHAIELQYEEE